MGRPPKIDDTARVERLLESLAKGAPIRVACAVSGIDDSTYYRWMDRGTTPIPPAHADDPDYTDDDTPYREFRDRAVRTIAEAEESMLAVLREAATGTGTYADAKDWRAAEAYLRRRHPERYNVAAQRVTHSLDGVPAGMAGGGVGDDEAARLAESLSAYLRGVGDGQAALGSGAVVEGEVVGEA